MTIIITLIVFILLVLAIIWGHFLSRNKEGLDSNKQARDDTNVELYQEHKNEIEKDYELGHIDQENYEYLITELDKSLLQDISENKKSSEMVREDKTLSVIWPISISLFVLIFSFALYQKNGAFEQLSQPKTVQGQQAQSSPEHEAQITRFQEIRKAAEANPDNSEYWYTYGQALVGMGQFDTAIKAFDHVITLEGEKADLVGAKAQATYYKYEQKLVPEVQKLIDRALALDPLDGSTNILLGMHSFTVGEYQKAIDAWQKVIHSNRGNVNVEALTQAVNEAKNRLSMTASNSLTQTNTPPQDIEGPALTLDVSLSENILAKMIDSSDKVVFVYATAANGPRMPLAVVKIMASDLPTSITLTNANAMSPQMNLSSVEAVNIYAVVSHQGRPGLKTGDFKAEMNNVSVGIKDRLVMSIDTVVP